VGVSIEHGRKLGGIGEGRELRGDVGQGGGGVKFVAGVEKQDVVTAGLPQGFVHRVVESFVRFRTKHETPSVCDAAVKGGVFVDHPAGVVGRGPVDDEVLNVRILLDEYAVEGAPQGGGSVEAYGGDGKTDHKRGEEGEEEDEVWARACR